MRTPSKYVWADRDLTAPSDPRANPTRQIYKPRYAQVVKNFRHMLLINSFSLTIIWIRVSMFSKGRMLSGILAKSGPLDFATKNSFPLFLVCEKGLVHMYQNHFI